MSEKLSMFVLATGLLCICAGSSLAAHLIKQQRALADTPVAAHSPSVQSEDIPQKKVVTVVEQLLSAIQVPEHADVPTSSVPVQLSAESTAGTLIASSGEQPQRTLAPAGAGGVPFTTFTLTAGEKEVTVNSITIQQRGAGAKEAFDSIALNGEDGAQIGDEQGLHADSRATFKESITIPAHTAQTFTVVGNMNDDLSSFDGQAPQLAVVAIDASVAVTGLPVIGTTQIVNNTLVICSASAELSSDDPGTDISRYINDTGVRFSGIRITADSEEDLLLSGVTWDQAGTASADDVTNVTTVLGGIRYAAERDGRTYTSHFGSGITIRKGESLDIYVQGDITTSGVSRTLKFDIRSSDDVALSGKRYGFGVGLAASGNTATDGHSVFITSTGDSGGDEGTPFFSGSVVTIRGGTVNSIERATGN